MYRRIGIAERAGVDAVVEQAADSIVITGLDGTIQYVNPAFTAMTGYTREEAVGQHPSILKSGRQSDAFYQELWKTISSGQAWRGDLINRRKDGTFYAEEMQITPVEGTQGEIVSYVAIKRDVTAKKAAEGNLRESEERFRGVFEQAPFGMCVCRLDGHFIQVNEALCRMLGYSEAELLNKAWTDIIHPGDLDRSHKMMEPLLAHGGHSQESEKLYIHRTGTVMWARLRVSAVCDSSGSPAYLVAHVEDITERKRNAEALRESEDLFRIVADSCPAILWVTNAEGGNQFINRGFREFCETTYEEVEGHKWQVMIHPEDASGYVATFYRAVREHAPFQAEVRVRRADGQWRWLHSHAEPRFSPQGEFLGHVGISPDITGRKQAEQALHDSQRFAQSTIDTLSSHICVLDETGTLIAVNRSWKDFAAANQRTGGESREESPASWFGEGFNYLEVCDGASGPEADEAAAFAAGIRSVLKGECPQYAQEYSCHSPKEQRWFLAKVTGFLSHDLPRIVIEHHTITERKQVEQALRRSEERFREVFEHAPVGMCVSGPDRVLIQVNAALCRMLGYCEEELLGKSWQSMIHPDDLGISHQVEKQLRREPDACLETEKRYLHKNGTVVWGRAKVSAVRDAQDNPLYFVVHIEDITASKQAAEALRASEERRHMLAQALQSADECISITDTEDRILYVNDAFRRTYGYEEKELIGQPITMLRSARTSQEVQEAILPATLSGKWHGEIWNRAKNGRQFALVGIARDITERKRHEEELIQAREGADAANRAKSRFLANMSHEIRTPMNGVLGMLQLLLETDLTAEQQEYADVAKNSGWTLLALIDDILDLSKIEAHKITLENLEFNPRQTVEDVVGLLHVQADPKGLALRSHVAAEIPPLLRGDERRLRQVLTNLVGNAIKFTAQGEVAVYASLESQDGTKSTLKFAITDTGIGLPPGQETQLFSPFVQADVSTTRKYGGSGLGLAICKQLVELMGGTIGIESRQDQGSTFWFTVPLDPAAPAERPDQKKDERKPAPDAISRPIAAKARSSARALATGESKGHILVAEDNATNRLVAVAQLRKLGYRATAVNNGAEALEAVQQTHYDLVLMDCQMPLMDGFEASRRIRAIQPNLTIIAVTADAMPDDQDRCLREGMNGYLAKPVAIHQLREVLAKWLPASVPTGNLVVQ